MSCERIRKELGAYADRELPAQRRSAVAEHLRTCEGCSRELARIERLASLLREDSIPEVPAGLAERIIAHGQRQQKRRTHYRLPQIVWWDSMPSYMRAAAVVVLMVGLSVGTLLGLNVARNENRPLTTVATPAPDPTASFHADYLSGSPTGSTANVYLTLASSTGEGR